ncbi:MAG: type II toxin-antitoxin system RelE/ParE family toxin [Polyangiales bacterium]|jgi:proteic killer suppression protein
MIRGFGNQLAEDLYYDRRTKATRSFPPELRRIARRKILFLHDAAELRDLRSPPGNKLEALRGDRKGSHSIRINDQWRVVFVWKGSDAYEVEVVDYHR